MFYEVVGQGINFNFALRSMKSKKNQRSRHLKRKNIFKPRSLSNCFLKDQLIKVIQIKSIFMCLKSNNCYCLYEDKKTERLSKWS